MNIRSNAAFGVSALRPMLSFEKGNRFLEQAYTSFLFFRFVLAFTTQITGGTTLDNAADSLLVHKDRCKVTRCLCKGGPVGWVTGPAPLHHSHKGAVVCTHSVRNGWSTAGL